MSKPIVPFSEIVERIKDIISYKYSRKIFDKDVANELGLTPNSLRVYKVLNHIPYKHIVLFCLRYDVSIDWMLFDKSLKPKRLSKRGSDDKERMHN